MGSGQENIVVISPTPSKWVSALRVAQEKKNLTVLCNMMNQYYTHDAESAVDIIFQLLR